MVVTILSERLLSYFQIITLSLVFLITSTCFNVGTLTITSSKPENVCLSHTIRKEAQREGGCLTESHTADSQDTRI